MRSEEDLALLRVTAEIHNVRYGRSSVDDPDRFRWESFPPRHMSQAKQATYREIDSFIAKAFSSGAVENRAQLSDMLLQKGVEIARVTRRSMTLRDDAGDEYTFVGGKYHEEFYSGSIAEAHARERQRRSRPTGPSYSPR